MILISDTQCASKQHIPGSHYDPELKMHVFSIPTHHDIPLNVMRLAKKEFSSHLSARIARLEKYKNLSQLKSYQKAAISKGLDLSGRVLIADEMGLGKTVTSLGLAVCLEFPLLVVCPSSLKLNWQNEISKWLELDSLVITKGTDPIQGDIVIISYEILAKRYLEIECQTLILDESHSIKSTESKRCQSAATVAKNSKYAILLSGTPSLNRPIELYPQLNCLYSQFFPSKQKFGERYCNAFKGKYGWDYSGSSNLQELNFLLQKIMVRRLKKDVLKELPEKKRYKIYVKEASKDMRPKGKLSDAKVTQLYKETAETKLQPVISYLEKEINNRGKLVIFAHHSIMINSIEEMLIEKNIKHIKIDGSINVDKRQSLCDYYQLYREYRVALLSITAAGVGITLTKGDCCIFAEMYWNSAQIKQCEDRCHRIGREKDLVIKYLLMKNTIDDLQYPMIERKLNLMSNCLDGKNENKLVLLEKGQETLRDFAKYTPYKGTVVPSNKRTEKTAFSPQKTVKSKWDAFSKHKKRIFSPQKELSSPKSTPIKSSPAEITKIKRINDPKSQPRSLKKPDISSTLSREEELALQEIMRVIR